MLMRIAKIIQETYDVKTLRFQHEGSFTFKPGQFVMVSFDVEEEGIKKTVKRSYSISSSPAQKDFIDITLKIYPGGAFSKFAESLKEDDVIEVLGPFGRHFYYEDGKGNDLVFVAGGTGIAPIRSIIRYLVDNKMPANMLLFYSSKTEKDVIFKEELLKIEKENYNFKGIHTLTRHEGGDSWCNEFGRIDENLFKKYIEDLNSKKYYLCGSTEFVNNMYKILIRLKAPKTNIFVERFG